MKRKWKWMILILVVMSFSPANSQDVALSREKSLMTSGKFFLLPGITFDGTCAVISLSGAKSIQEIKGAAYFRNIERYGQTYEFPAEWSPYYSPETFRDLLPETRYEYMFVTIPGYDKFTHTTIWFSDYYLDRATNFFGIDIMNLKFLSAKYLGDTVFINYNFEVITTSGVEKVKADQEIYFVDRIRCDVNDDGLVNEADLKILDDSTKKGVYVTNFALKKDSARGIDCNAGVIFDNAPNEFNNYLLRLWLANKGDPMLQDLGIGISMSKTAKNFMFPMRINSYKIIGNRVTCFSDMARFFWVKYALPGVNTEFVACQRIGEEVILPEGAIPYQFFGAYIGTVTDVSTPKYKETNIKVYPNPAVNEINIKATGPNTVQVFNLASQLVFKSSFTDELIINSKYWQQGMYLLKIDSQCGSQVVKMIKK